MECILKVTRRGQVTIPIELREKYGIEYGDEILFEDREGEIVMRVVPRLEEMAGIYAELAAPAEMKKRVDKLRKKYLG